MNESITFYREDFIDDTHYLEILSCFNGLEIDYNDPPNEIEVFYNKIVIDMNKTITYEKGKNENTSKSIV